MDELERRFTALAPSLRRLEEEAKFILSEELQRSGIKTHSILSRVKSLESLREKISRKNISDPFDNVEDLVGLRVVCLFRSDIKNSGQIVRDQFEVLSEDNKLDGVSVDVFGYQSVHFVSRLKHAYTGPRYQGLHDLRIEIQLRTIAMDTWATLSHYLDYKSEPDVPRELRKDFFALSGLFYIADTHFELFYEARQRAGVSARQKVKSTPTTDQELNLDTLAAYLAQRYPDRKHSNPNSVSQLMSELTAAGYSNLRQLHTVLEYSAAAFVQYESSHPPSVGRFGDIGVVRISLAIADPKFYELRGSKSDEMLNLRKRLGGAKGAS